MITKKDVSKSLKHNHGGNGFAVVQWLHGNDYCRVVFWSNLKDKPEIGDRAFLAYTGMLSVETSKDPISDQVNEVVLPQGVIDLLISKRKALETGKEKVVCQRFVPT